MARKQNIEYMEDLSQRALALRDGDGTLTEADEPGAPAEENAAVATDSPAAENAEPGYAEPKDEDDAAEPQEDTTGAGAPESAGIPVALGTRTNLLYTSVAQSNCEQGKQGGFGDEMQD